MIGPAKSDQHNYGLGVATENIAQQLSKVASLTIISPTSATATDATASTSENIALSVDETLLDTKAVEADAVHITVKSKLKPYFYHSHEQVVASEQSESGVNDIQAALEVYTKSVEQKAATLKYDVIYAHDWMSIDAALQLKNKYHKPLILHIHALDYDRVGKKTNSWIYQLEKKGMEQADKVIAVSEYHAHVMQKVYGINKDKISIIHLGIAQSAAVEYQSPFQEDIVLFAGRLSKQKGIFDFVDIASSLIKTHDNLRFVVAGEGELSQEVVSRVNEKALQDHFHFVGLLDRPALHGLMQQCKVLVVPSISEPFGLVALEAALNELPVVISPSSGVSEILTGAICPKSTNIEDYVKAINHVLEDASTVTKAVATNKEAALSRSWDQVGKEVYNVLSDQHE